MIAIQRQGARGFEESTVELQNVATQYGGIAAVVHRLPQGFDDRRKVLFIVAQAFEQIEPRAVGQEANVFGERGEDAAGEKLGHFFGLVLELEVSRQYGKLACDLSRDARPLQRRV